MMGRSEVQENLYYRVRIDDHVPKDHLLRKIDWLLDFDMIRYELADLYSHTGPPSVDPELMLRILLVGYLYGIRSERRLVEEVYLISAMGSGGNYALASGRWLRDDDHRQPVGGKNRRIMEREDIRAADAIGLIALSDSRRDA